MHKQNNSNNDTGSENPSSHENIAGYKLLVDYCSDLMWNMNPEGIFLDLSLSWLNVTGYEPSALKGKSFVPLIHPDYIHVCLENLEKLKSVKEITAIPEFLVKHADNTWHWHTAKAAPVINPDNELISIVGVSRDITERKQAEEKLRCSELRYRALFENINSGVAIFEAVDNGCDFIFRDFNNAGEKYEDEKRDELIGRRITDIRPRLKETGVLDLFRRVWETGISEHFPEKLYKYNRRAVWYEFYVYKLPSGEIVAVFDDVSRYKRIEEEFVRSIERFRTLSDNIPAGVCMFMPDSTIMYANRSIGQFTGIEYDEILGRRFFDFIDDTHIKKIKEELESLTPENPIETHEQVYTDRNGKMKYQHWTNRAFFNNEGNANRYIGIGIDITGQKEREIQLKNSELNFRTFVETLDEMVFICATDGRIIYSNPSAIAKLGYSAEELSSMQILDLHPSWAREEAGVIVSEMLVMKRDKCPLPLLHKNGSTVPVETRVSFGKWNGMDCIFGISKDLSKEQEALQKFEKLFRMNPAPMAISRISGREIVDVNNAFLQTLGYARDEVVGKSSSELGLFADAEGQEKIAQELSEYGSVREIDLKIRTKSNMIREGLFSGEIVSSQGNDYFLTVMIDITERKKAESEKEEVIKELRNAIEQIKTLTGLLPICSYCKKNRDDNGQWEQIEVYIRDRSEADFTHSLCPECVRKYYPGITYKK